MRIEKARSLLREPIKDMPLEKLQRHKVNLIDAWRHSKADYGYPQAVAEGFYKVLESESASGFFPTDMWLTRQIEYRMDEVDYELLKIYRSEGFLRGRIKDE